MTMTYAVLGGDQRQLELAKLLQRDGKQVFLWGFDDATCQQATLEEATAADVVILPLPVSRDDETLYLPLSRKKVLLCDLWLLLDSRRQLICGGGMTEALMAVARWEHVTPLDYFAREETRITNAIPTAEGAIYEAMGATSRTIHGAKALVIGHGRIGRMLAHRLGALGAEVTVSARRYSDAAWTESMGWRALRTEALDGELAEFNLIFNTVPELILRRNLLEQLQPDCVVIDLASAPGGTDFKAAAELGVQVIWARGLPGRVAPLTAAEAIRDAIYHILEERGEPI